MMQEDYKMTFKYMKEERYSRTKILNRFKSGYAILIYSYELAKRIYKLSTDKGEYALKVINFSIGDKEYKKRAEEEFKLASRAYKLSGGIGVAEPIAYETESDRVGGIVSIESLYEYGGENLIRALKEASNRKIVSVLQKVVDAMAVLHENRIFHSDLKPTNVVYREGVVKIIDFGVSMELASNTKLFVTATENSRIVGYTPAFCPPEVIRGKSYILNKVDVYSWGMMLYQLLFRKSNRELIIETDLKKSDKGYNEFLNQITKDIANIDDNEQFKNDVINILLKVFDIDPKKRPTFAELKEMFRTCESFKNNEASPKAKNKIVEESIYYMTIFR